MCLFASDLQESGIGHHLGVYMTQDEQESISSSALELLGSLGFTIIELEGRAPQSLLNSIDETEFYIFVSQPRKFVTSYQLQQNESLYFRNDLSLIDFYENQIGDRISAYSLFIYPDDRKSHTSLSLDRYMSRFTDLQEDGKQFYYRSAYPGLDNYPAGFSFRSTRFIVENHETLPSHVLHFTTSDKTLYGLKELKKVLELSLNTEQSVILISYSWLIETLERFELLGEALIAYTRNQTILFPEPVIAESPLSPNWAVILLILLIGSYLVHYHNNPVYQRSVLRYFTMHKFFVEDILENRLRTSTSALILFSQHIILTALLFYILAETLISNLGLASIYHHFPFLELLGKGSTGLFFTGICISLLLQTISVFWIHQLNRKTKLSQTVTLYCWPLQLNLPVVLILTAVYQANGADGWIILMTVLFVINWFFGFNIASLDIAKTLTRYRITYIIFTVGLHVLILIMLAAVVLIYDPVSGPLHMAFNLP